ncbi:SEC-C domain-containing protein [Gracilibacillus caseinilyticus]|uniref:SEC-C domain-containing protein n=1 Tax=Gracilibacillus caseinilyticus TaxID=2932256 RepID=A0ABY4EZI7_9BACI|nr:SEC-C metal-binding domain-containing protein [Gracilibacillus caseinilyticus]UOQ49823.1 SEC-C domain-containing protein [Gracilibacillus caseinilyticus]
MAEDLTIRKPIEKMRQHADEILSPSMSLTEILNKYPKKDLDKIRGSWKLTGLSQLKKDELVAVLAEKIPEMLWQKAYSWDTDLMKRLKKVITFKGKNDMAGMPFFTEHYLCTHGIIFPEVVNGEEVLILPEQLEQFIEALLVDPEVREIHKRNKEWRQLTYGLLHFYGTLDAAQLYKLLEGYTNTEIDAYELMSVLPEMNAFHDDFIIDEHGLSDMLVRDPERVKAEHNKRPDVDFYPFSKAKLIEANKPFYTETNQSYRKFVSYITNHYDIDKLDAAEIVDECVIHINYGKSLGEVMEFLSEAFEFEGRDSLQAFTAQVVQLMNNTRQWILKGHTPMELRDKNDSTIIPFSQKKAKNNKTVTKTKIGRNDPCPCGSGKKYKKCCGR